MPIDCLLVPKRGRRVADVPNYSVAEPRKEEEARISQLVPECGRPLADALKDSVAELRKDEEMRVSQYVHA